MHITVAWCDTCLGTIRATLGTIRATLGPSGPPWGPPGSCRRAPGAAEPRVELGQAPFPSLWLCPREGKGFVLTLEGKEPVLLNEKIEFLCF